MTRDPLYQKIVAGLAGRLDPELFERCAAALLSLERNVVPIRGGRDSGMDGAVADGQGQPYPLISTTAEDLVRNLRTSLESYRKTVGARLLAIFATPRVLNAGQRQTLESAASELGFTLVQIYDGAAFADRLYRNAEWRLELLGITGAPTALSALPSTSRFQTDGPLIGRDEVCAWLTNAQGDLLLSGQPGMGKTSVLRTLVKADRGLFLVSDDMRMIADAVRDLQPEVILIDDAHLNIELLRKVAHLRQELEAAFRIAADCWPADCDSLVSLLDLEPSQYLQLEPLTRDQMVEVVKALGIAGPNALIRELVTQADGKPGLAVTLCRACLRRGIQRIVSGEELVHEITRVLGQSERSKLAILAAFSCGGSAGMDAEAVVQYWGIDMPRLYDALKLCTHCGVLEQVRDYRYAVHPAPLRSALIREVFFSGTVSIPCQSLLAAPDHDQMVQTLIGAAGRGAHVSSAMIESFLVRCRSEESWQSYAHLGKAQTEWVLASHPQRLNAIAPAALRWCPEAAIPKLLSQAAADDRPTNAHTDHPLRKIESWVKEPHSYPPAPDERRLSLAKAAIGWIESGGDQKTGLRAVGLALETGFEYVESDPGSGFSFTLRGGVLSRDKLTAIRQNVWPEVLVFLRAHEVQDWDPILLGLEQWVYPGRGNQGMPREIHDLILSYGKEIIIELASFPHLPVGVRSRMAEVSRRLGIEVAVDLDPEFAVLFPARDYTDWRAAEERQDSDVQRLCMATALRDPADVAHMLARFEREAQRAGIKWPRWTPRFCGYLAESVDDPVLWGRAFAASMLPGECVYPFLRAARDRSSPEWASFARSCLDNEILQWAVILVVLTTTTSPKDLVDEVLGKLEGFSSILESACVRGEVPEPYLRRLLRHDDHAIVAAAASGEWHSDPVGSARKSLRSLWRNAVVRCVDDHYSLSDFFRKDSLLAFRWLKRRIESRDEEYYFRCDDHVEVAASVLTETQRRKLLSVLPQAFWARDIAKILVAKSVVLYRVLLADKDLRGIHLGPLAFLPDAEWREMALAALESGHEAMEVAGAAYGGVASWSGPESAMWAEWVSAFTPMLTDSDVRVRDVAANGIALAKARMESALREERTEAVKGFIRA